MPLSESERLQQRVDSMNKILHTAKTRDSSEQTFITQMRAGSVEHPQLVAGVKEKDGAACNYVTMGKGTNMEYGNVMLKAQSCAVCADPALVTWPSLYQVIPGCSTTAVSSFYTAPCKIPGYQVFFPPRIADGKNCVLNREYYGSYP